MNRVDRLLAYLLLLQSRGLMRARDFADRFEISERTVYRDIQALSEVGVPIVALPGEGYRLMEGYYLPPITFTPDEARALFLSVSMLEAFTTSGLTKTAVTSALDKVRAVLPDRTRRQVEALQAILSFYIMPAPPINFDDDVFLQLQEAIHERRVVRLDYHAQHSNELTQREVEPTELVLLANAWTLTAYCRLRQAKRHFRLDRIDRLSVTPEHFDRRDIRSSQPVPGPVAAIVRFDAATLRWVREKQHYTFVEEQADPDITDAILMVYRPRRFGELAPWLLQWGDQMELLAPQAWRTELRGIVAEMVARHQPQV